MKILDWVQTDIINISRLADMFATVSNLLYKLCNRFQTIYFNCFLFKNSSFVIY